LGSVESWSAVTVVASSRTTKEAPMKASEEKALVSAAPPEARGRMELAVSEVAEQMTMMQMVLKQVMKEDEHYGIIPGTGSSKPCLLKAGAEKLVSLFKLAPKYLITERDFDGGHREYTVVCELYDLDGRFRGQGVGLGSSMETKWSTRKGDPQFTGEPVPSAYWDSKNKALLGGGGRVALKNPKTRQWEIAVVTREPIPNPADVLNTVLKMAKKRALVDAVLSATGASDIFTQDLEELVEIIVDPPHQVRAVEPVGAKRPVQEAPEQVAEATEPAPAAEEAAAEVYDHREHLLGCIREVTANIDALLAADARSPEKSWKALILKHHQEKLRGLPMKSPLEEWSDADVETFYERVLDIHQQLKHGKGV